MACFGPEIGWIDWIDNPSTPLPILVCNSHGRKAAHAFNITQVKEDGHNYKDDLYKTLKHKS